MERKIICPICHNINEADADQCAYCGQSFKEYNDDNMGLKRYSTYKRQKFQSWKSWIIILIVAVFCVATLLVSHNKQAISAISVITPQKITSVKDITVYINENDKYSLPPQVAARMSNGRSEAVSIKWQTKAIDSSEVGTKIITGKVKGYDRLVKLNLTVFPQKVKNTLGDCTVENSLVDYNINVDKKIKYIRFEIHRIHEDNILVNSIYQFAKVNNGVAKIRLYLPFGSGEYKIATFNTENSDGQNGYNISRIFSIINNDKRDMSFLMPEEYVQSDSPEIIKLAYDITKNCYNDMEKTTAIHDWVAKHIAYDTSGLNEKVYEYSAVETLEKRKAVCNGYANLTAALNRAVGIRAKLIKGTAGGGFMHEEMHEWNETFIDGKWIIQDTTWDAGYVNSASEKFVFRFSHKYFNPSPYTFEMDHTKIDES